MRALLLALVLIVLPHMAWAALSVNVSSDVIKVSTGFNGASITVFGTQEGAGALVLVVEGPAKTFVVNEKDRVAGMWTETKGEVYKNIPAYYAMAASTQLDDIATPDVLAANRLTYTSLLPEDNEYGQALIRIQESHGLYGTDITPIDYATPLLFKTRFDLPASVAHGTYKVIALLFRNGVVAEVSNATFEVEADGFSSDVRRFAMDDGFLYGMIGVLMALVAGWLANVLLKRE